MTIQTLTAYWAGNREAILRIAASRNSLVLGLLFVISAGFAREYDGEDLWHEPWHLAIPLGASLVSSLLLYGLIDQISRLQGKPSPFWEGYRVFLSLFWMTAPLAWLYAIPVERFMSAADAVRANLWLLAIVATWRVALITRVVSVLYRIHWATAFFVVMLFADALLWGVLALTPLPILSVMGGIRLTESEDVLLATGLMLRVLATLSAPVWLFGTIAVAFRRSPDPLAWQRVDLANNSTSQVNSALWCLAVSALLVWAIVLPITQPEQANRRLVEKALQDNQIREALQYMSARERRDFPPHWDPPPRIGYGDETPDIWGVLRCTKDRHVAPWVRSIYIDKILTQAEASPYGGQRIIDLTRMNTDALETYVRLLHDVGTGQKIAAAHKYEIEEVFARAAAVDSPEPLSEQRRVLLTEILQLGTDGEITGSPEPAPADAPVEPAIPAPQSDAR